jgi:hypothetical protein
MRVCCSCLPACKTLVGGGIKIKLNIKIKNIFFGAKDKSIAKRKG